MHTASNSRGGIIRLPHCQWLSRVFFCTAVSCSFGDAHLYGQFESGQIQPYTPSVVGGLPPNSSGLEQPVYVASRSMDGASVSSMQYADYLDESEFPIPTEPRLEFKEFMAGELLAMVGQEPVTLGQLIDPKLATAKTLSTPGFEMGLRKALTTVIVRKALYQRFIDQQVAGKGIKERESARRQIDKKITEAFYKDALPGMMKQNKCETVDEFHEQLAEKGTTLASLQREWAENVIASEAIKGAVTTKPVIELGEMQDYYHDRIADYERPAKARFEILTAEFKKHPNKQAAYDAVAEMGNQVFFGKPLDTVAKSLSSGWAASNGGKVDWTTQGALKSKPIDEAVFALPLNELSSVIEDSEGFHIVRVLERQQAMTLPFTEVQSGIREKLVESKSKKSEKEFLEKVKNETPVWTRWPEDFPNAKPLDELRH